MGVQRALRKSREGSVKFDFNHSLSQKQKSREGSVKFDFNHSLSQNQVPKRCKNTAQPHYAEHFKIYYKKLTGNTRYTLIYITVSLPSEP